MLPSEQELEMMLPQYAKSQVPPPVHLTRQAAPSAQVTWVHVDAEQLNTQLDPV
jgi:hypothetical protein